MGAGQAELTADSHRDGSMLADPVEDSLYPLINRRLMPAF